MTTIQIKIALTIERLGSISNTAKEIGISQPNVSKYLQSLENEIGFEIFDRAKRGMAVTEKGKIFLEHAKKILLENDEIMDIQNHCNSYRLRVGAVNYLSASEPFLKICEEHREDKEAEFCFYDVSIDEGIDELYKYNLDVVFIAARKEMLEGVKFTCQEKDLLMLHLGAVPAVISVRKGHPALLDGRCEKIFRGSDAMKDYPYAAYRNCSKDSVATNLHDTEFIQSKYIMYVDEVVVRLRLVASTNAFMFGITPSKGVNERYGLVSFPVPGVFMDMFCIVRRSDCERREIKEYISLLKEELDL